MTGTPWPSGPLLRQVSSAMGHELELFPELVGSV